MKQLKEHEIRGIYEQLLLKVGPNIASNKTKPTIKESSAEKKDSKEKVQ